MVASGGGDKLPGTLIKRAQIRPPSAQVKDCWAQRALRGGARVWHKDVLHASSLSQNALKCMLTIQEGTKFIVGINGRPRSPPLSLR